MKALRIWPPCKTIVAVVAVVLLPTLAGGGIENTLHDLTARGRGREHRISDACAFCHIPHNANPTRALWNRDLSAISYELYQSPTLEATVLQPTGASRMCLSCHDGTIALEDIRVNRRGMQVTLGRLKGKNSLETDLSDDHPISFTYDTTLANRQGELADPKMLPPWIKLEFGTELQCTSCHDPHEDRNAKFLVRGNRFSELCVSCHQIRGWPSSIHARSLEATAANGQSSAADSKSRTIAENGCANCHRTHSADQPQWLLNSEDEESICLDCHSGSAGAKDIDRDFNKQSAHPVYETDGVHDPKEGLGTMQRHVTCTDCHNAHAMQSSTGGPTSLPPSLKGAQGLNSSGSELREVSAEYEVCFGCHGVTEQPRAVVTRMDNVTNARLEFSPSNRSYHPVVVPGGAANRSSLEINFAGSSRILCTDCHNSDSQNASGPHGSVYAPILEREYRTESPAPESSQTYALCYKCHNRDSLLTDKDGFPHQTHVVQGGASCAACHDAHGSRYNTHLINFMIEDAIGGAGVSPSSSGRLEFQDLGQSQGQCYLNCHGIDHNPKSYPGVPQSGNLTVGGFVSKSGTSFPIRPFPEPFQ